MHHQSFGFLQDEVERLDSEIEERHSKELADWESSHVEEDLTNTSLVAPSDGLYDLKIGDSEDKQTKVSCKPWPPPNRKITKQPVSETQA